MQPSASSRLDEIDGRKEAAARASTDAGAGDGDRQMSFAGSRAANEYDVALLDDEAPPARSRTSAPLIGVSLKAKSSTSLASGRVWRDTIEDPISIARLSTIEIDRSIADRRGGALYVDDHVGGVDARQAPGTGGLTAGKPSVRTAANIETI